MNRLEEGTHVRFPERPILRHPEKQKADYLDKKKDYNIQKIQKKLFHYSTSLAGLPQHWRFCDASIARPASDLHPDLRSENARKSGTVTPAGLAAAC
jgi:hypothetical protein